MEFTITVNNITVKVSQNETILTVLQRLGINIPTLCNLPELSPTGACRLCVVELADSHKLVTACSTPVSEGMKVLTHSSKVINARKTIVSLLLSNHPENCLFCDKNKNCELQLIAESLNIRERSFTSEPKITKTDRSSPGIIREMSKCILCGRCVRICEEELGISAIDIVNRGKNIDIETVFKRGLFYSNCIHCGKCITYCPTGAIVEKSYVQNILDKLSDNSKEKIIAVSNISIADIASEFGIKKFVESRNFIVGALKDIGFNKVLTLNPGNEIFISEVSDIIIKNLRNKEFKTLILTDCPAIKKYIKNELTQLQDLLCKVGTPQQILAKLVKNDENSQILFTSVASCVAYKYEAVQSVNTTKGVPDIDFVISSRELLKLFKTHGIEFPYSRKQTPDKPSNSDSGAGALFETNGGISETVIREIFFRTGKIFPKKIFELKQEKEFVEYSFEINGMNYVIAVINSIPMLREKTQEILAGKYLFVEVRICKYACLSGNGLNFNNDDTTIKKIKKIILDFDESNSVDTVGKNPFIKAYYRNKNKM